MFLYYSHKMKYNCCQFFFSVFEKWIVYLVFLRGKCVAKGFIYGCICDSSCGSLYVSGKLYPSPKPTLTLTSHLGQNAGLFMQPLTVDYRKYLLTFQIFCLRVLPLPPQNEMQILSRFFCYSKLVCLFGFGLRKAWAFTKNGFKNAKCSFARNAYYARFNHVELPKYGYMHVGTENTFMELWSFPVLYLQKGQRRETRWDSLTVLLRLSILQYC